MLNVIIHYLLLCYFYFSVTRSRYVCVLRIWRRHRRNGNRGGQYKKHKYLKNQTKKLFLFPVILILINDAMR